MGKQRRKWDRERERERANRRARQTGGKFTGIELSPPGASSFPAFPFRPPPPPFQNLG